MQSINTIFFDLFNTLLSVGEVPDSVGRFTADVLGVDHEQWNAMCFSDDHEICQPTVHLEVLTTLARRIDPAMPLALIEEATRHRQKRFDYALLNVHDEVLQSLSELKRAGYRLALISNASTAEVLSWQQSPLVELMEHAIFSCDSGYKKPDNSIYRHALDRMQTSAECCLFVGDGGSDELIGAHQAGLTTVLTRQFSKSYRLEKVRKTQGEAIHHEVGHIREVMDLLK